LPERRPNLVFITDIFRGNFTQQEPIPRLLPPL
jgi:hypothetical protein